MEIQEALSEPGPATNKFQDIFGLKDRYTDEDSDVSQLDGLAIPSTGPVFVPAANVILASAFAPSASVNPRCKRESTPSATSAASSLSEADKKIASSRSEGDHEALSSEMLQKIAENKVSALARRSAKRSEAHCTESQEEIFKAVQWLPQ